MRHQTSDHHLTNSTYDIVIVFITKSYKKMSEYHMPKTYIKNVLRTATKLIIDKSIAGI